MPRRDKPLPIKNRLGKWVGGFPIERTYTEWLNSRYADRPGNRHFDPVYKRDCHTCHKQQDYGHPGTAQTLYRDGTPDHPLTGAVATDGQERPCFSHHFVGGDAYVPRAIGRSVDSSGRIDELLVAFRTVFVMRAAEDMSVQETAECLGSPKRRFGVASSRARALLREALACDLDGATTLLFRRRRSTVRPR